MSPASTSSVVGVEGHDSCDSQSLQGFTNSPANRTSRRGLLRQRFYEKRRFARAEGPCKHVSLSADVEFIGRVGDRVTGKKLEDLVFVELFSGTGGLCAEVRRLGLSNSIGVDARISKHTKCPVLRIDMTTDYGMELVWRILGQENCIAVHMGPPCVVLQVVHVTYVDERAQIQSHCGRIGGLMVCRHCKVLTKDALGYQMNCICSVPKFLSIAPELAFCALLKTLAAVIFGQQLL